MKTLEAERLDLKQAAAYLGIPTRSLRAKCRCNLITHVRFDRTNWRFLRSDLDAYLERHRSVAKTLFEKK
jgi:excisionase family DNA binding protein